MKAIPVMLQRPKEYVDHTPWRLERQRKIGGSEGRTNLLVCVIGRSSEPPSEFPGSSMIELTAVNR